MTPQRLRAPANDGSILEVPPLSDAPDRLRENAKQLNGWTHDFQGRTADRLRSLARPQILQRARAFHDREGLAAPLYGEVPAFLAVTGHQPELFHPGVWIKNFAAAAIGKAVGGVGLNIIVDNDVPKSPTIRVPSESAGELSVAPVGFDDWKVETPYEDQAIHDQELFRSFLDRVLERLDGLVTDPLIRRFWPKVIDRPPGASNRVGIRFARARHEVEADWGTRNWEVPISEVCETEAFGWFASHLLAHLPRFQAVHNEALSEYRRLYKIRSVHHPVPALGRQGDWLEAPFWVWRATEPRRRPLFARQRGQMMDLRIGGESEPFLELPLSPDREACCSVTSIQELASRNIRFRTRALTTTMFARLLLGDLFLHGIGGAKYDELGDEVVRRFFGITPPAFLTLSLSAWLGMNPGPHSPTDLSNLQWSARNIAFNPDRHLPDSVRQAPDVRELLHRKTEALAAPVETHAQRKARFRRLVEINDALRPWVQDEIERKVAERQELLGSLRRRTIARSREFASILHSEGKLKAAFARVERSFD